MQRSADPPTRRPSLAIRRSQDGAYRIIATPAAALAAAAEAGEAVKATR